LSTNLHLNWACLGVGASAMAVQHMEFRLLLISQTYIR